MNNDEITVTGSSSEPESTRLSGKMRIIIVTVIAVLFSALLIIISVSGMVILHIMSEEAPSLKIISLLEEGNYDDALFVYKVEFPEESNKERLIKHLKDRINTLGEGITSDELQLKEILDELKAIKSMDIPEINKYIRESIIASEILQFIEASDLSEPLKSLLKCFLMQ